MENEGWDEAGRGKTVDGGITEWFKFKISSKKEKKEEEEFGGPNECLLL